MATLSALLLFARPRIIGRSASGPIAPIGEKSQKRGPLEPERIRTIARRCDGLVPRLETAWLRAARRVMPGGDVAGVRSVCGSRTEREACVPGPTAAKSAGKGRLAVGGEADAQDRICAKNERPRAVRPRKVRQYFGQGNVQATERACCL